ncbi:2-C-methyl-D-erythritol 4-phosphate cytidylyltransferase [Allocatelliglobosispora scoriae]|uniref:2-C-methyl-D-erythritol 4-phosphate cytidylyltransferase n=1 Tax=Allocatelliglobosispora scoriae TaxID=643052 RepID=A0A841BU94_9ACTN|nr:2-C-methyl-D-erythritol 4-phosphate cytidylyltransferase [Allocatelliglobosispora scoriae]MBB5870729.1 2-C-methyl-D-erythritol 4-phosphate cytidylyltransferase [Allocatelliglobosispora scoriae]
MTAQRNPRGDVAVLVPAAGLGLRLGPGAPKALRELAGESLLVHALRRLGAADSVGLIVVAAPPGGEASVAALLAQSFDVPGGGLAAHVQAVPPHWVVGGESTAPAIIVVGGGVSRQESVANALAVVPAEFEIILVHDAARALTPPALVDAVAAAVRGGHDAVIPVLPVVDTIKRVTPGEAVVATVDRAELRAVQTPQGFRRSVLVKAHQDATDQHTDDAGMVERMGLPVQCVPGSELALKITRPIDMIIAEALLGEAQ